MNALKVLGLLGFLACANQASAGTFSVQCYGDVKECATPVAEIVTDKFTTLFPSTKWQISVIAEFQPYSDGGGVGYAVAGVIPRASGQVPLHRFSATMRIDKTRKIDALEVQQLTLEVYQDAVKQLMARCEVTKDCDVYKARATK